ncbi:MAG: NAD(P)/FAD-dependent oxidoreductase [Campylobacterota bacterium]|nr:NAD(P)/FAD-dependent oxidoreductase [Campylobacterota bacterium]
MQKCCKKIAIIGAGASGLVCAIEALKRGFEVDVFEQNDRVAKKIIASGNGRCNISNRHLHVEDYYGEDIECVKSALLAFDFTAFERFCMEAGLLLHVKDDGRVYPLSNDAKSVASLFESYARKLGASFFLNCTVSSLSKDTKFALHVEDVTYTNYDNVVVCSGSLAWPMLGVSAIGYEIAKSFGHEIQELYASLVQLHVEHLHISKLSGLKMVALVSLYVNGKKEQEIVDDVLFTKYGVSGFAILDISQNASYALTNFQSVKIGVNFLPNFDRAKLLHVINSFCSSEKSVVTMLCGIIPKKLALTMCEILEIPKEKSSTQLNTKEIKKIASMLNDWRLEISETHGLKHSEVSGGGVSLAQINPKTFESKNSKGLYFCGEVLDVVGKRGGYNLHFAFASGYSAIKSLK